MVSVMKAVEKSRPSSSPNSVDEAVRTAIAKAAETVRNIEWFQTEEIRGQVVDGGVAYFQVRLKIGFRVD